MRGGRKREEAPNKKNKHSTTRRKKTPRGKSTAPIFFAHWFYSLCHSSFSSSSSPSSPSASSSSSSPSSSLSFPSCSKRSSCASTCRRSSILWPPTPPWPSRTRSSPTGRPRSTAKICWPRRFRFTAMNFGPTSSHSWVSPLACES
eukprot:GHVT01042812.1.p2 GENE.GHVT01042812.1~~GHVT01042812.1.p2  ORF type:complete len:146 (+),score=36.17 GHVT01042812.1:1995-2432(+)